ncbi:cytochrome P450 [Pluteus cervinus]|uniref:Cytochrome P450 n=1 Tax=Pluteus cervinus TaxID=181527 RepID=A0ACD3B2I1_9AGAR|nr:cytochrome P450 [Pluteus cervinus]
MGISHLTRTTHILEDLTWPKVFLGIAVIFIISRINNFIKGLKAVSYLAGPRVPFPPLSLPGALLPTLWWNPGPFFVWTWRNHFYRTWGRETVAIVPWLSGQSTLVTTNLDVARQVTLGGHRSSWEKPLDKTQALFIFGMNLVTAEGELWRKHRRIVGPAFANDLYQFVWQETRNIYKDMIETEGWSNVDTVSVSAVQNLTFKVALLVIGNCGFGFNFHWSEPPTSADGTTSIQESLHTITDWYMLDIVLPKWFTKLPVPQFRRYRAAKNQLMNFMHAQIAGRRNMIQGGAQLRKDAFTILVKANEDEEAKLRLGDDELVGNVFAMLLAGHETTAHTMAATLGLLAINQDIQDETYEEIVSVIGHRDPVFSDFTKLEKVTSAFYEALRMFPAGFLLIRKTTEDTVLHIPNPVGQEGTTSLPIPKGIEVIVDMIGVQNNPRYFDEPGKFKPQRWYGVSKESESFSAFSVGPRACIGRKFATLESVCFLTCLLRDWKVEPVLKSGETKEEWKERVVDAKITVTLGVKDIPIRFIRRVARK